MPPYIRQLRDRGGSQRQGAQHLHGHATIAITLDLYGHLMPGSESEAAEMLDAYLAAQRNRADNAVRTAGGFAHSVSHREPAPAS